VWCDVIACEEMYTVDVLKCLDITRSHKLF
ncbi:MAG: hypothetical protein ACI9O4_002015, partial [Chitinophagales bacterium]